MKFSCEKCSARYSIPDEKVHGKVLKVRCKKCSHVIVVRAKRGGAAAKSSSDSQRVQWYVAIKGKQHGPMTQDGVSALFNKGRIRDRSFVWHKGLKAWTRLMELEEFKDILYPNKGASPQPSPQAPSKGPETEAIQPPQNNDDAAVKDAKTRISEPEKQTTLGEQEVTAQHQSLSQKIQEPETTSGEKAQADLSSDHDEKATDSIGDSFQADAFGSLDTVIDTSSPFHRPAGQHPDKTEKSDSELMAAFDNVMGSSTIPKPSTASDTSDDPFANVPDLQQGDAAGFGGVAENTRIFMMRAGLHNRKKKQMSYAIASFVLIALFSSALALDYYGVIEIPFMHSVTSFVVEKTNIPPPKRKWATADDLEPGDSDLKCKMMGNCPKKVVRKKRKKGKKDNLLDGVNLDDAFQTAQGSSGVLTRSGVGKNGMADIGMRAGGSRSQEFAQLLGRGGPSRASPIGKADKPKEESGSTLDPKNVSTVARAGQAGIKQCLESAMKRKEKVKGEKKKRLILTINPNGRVGKAVFTDPILNAQPLGECILQRAKRWKFAPFSGEPTEVVLPVILTTSL